MQRGGEGKVEERVRGGWGGGISVEMQNACLQTICR